MSEGTLLEMERTARATVDGEIAEERSERIYVVVGERHTDGSYDAEALLVAMDGGDRIGRIQYRIRLASDLTLLGDPIEECEDLPDELEPERILRHVLGAVPRPPSREQEYEADLWSDLREQPLVAEVEIERRDHDRHVRARAAITLDGDRFGDLVVRGRATARVIADTDATMLVGRIRTRIGARVEVRDSTRARAGTRPGQLQIDEELVVTRRAGSLPREDTCREATSGEFDVREVVRAIQARQAEIRQCYERELRRDPTIAGTVRVSMTVHPSGEVTGARVTESTLDTAPTLAIGACVVRVIDSFHFDPGPVGGSVTYAFPFVFEPLN